MLDEVLINKQRLSYWKNDRGFSDDVKTIVFIHGSGGSHDDWMNQINSLKDNFNIAAPDLPGHGRSEGNGESEVSAYVEVIEKFIQSAGITRPVLVGHSLGAAICLEFAIRYKDSCAAIVPVGGGVRMPVNPMILDGLKNDPAATISMIAKFSITKANREKYHAFIAEAISRVNPEITYGDFTACNRLDVTERISGITVPTLVICGKEDKMTPPSFSEYIRDNIPGAKLVLIPDAGHFAMLENPIAFNKTIADFVSSLPA